MVDPEDDLTVADPVDLLVASFLISADFVVFLPEDVTAEDRRSDAEPDFTADLLTDVEPVVLTLVTEVFAELLPEFARAYNFSPSLLKSGRE